MKSPKRAVTARSKLAVGSLAGLGVLSKKLLSRQIIARQTVCGTVTVSAEFSPSAVTIASCANPTSEVSPGESLTVPVTISNANDVSVTGSVTVAIGGQTGERQFTLGANGSTTVDVSLTVPTTPNEYEITSTLNNVAQA